MHNMLIKRIKPLDNRVLVKRLRTSLSRGNIIIPDAAQEKSKEGEIVAIGPGKMDEKAETLPIGLKVGDRVFFASYAGTEVNIEQPDAEYLIMSEEDILAIVN